ncbi:MAG TPA: beta-ketoacyl synthase N-terminal-like domain-containing protein [Myxococcota bacterium]|jgi:acetyl-CoA C-acetyltransferase|nr:beta-ketoacyl synthase N-terminal-like domain-containing protein [Myxococcota bacterium]
MSKEVYIAGVGLTKVDLTGRIFGSTFDLFGEAYRHAVADSPLRSFDAVQIGVMDSEEFENRANVAAKVADHLRLTGIPAIRSETASSTGAAAFHEACYKIASGQFESVLVLCGERMKTVTTEVATSIMSKTVAPEERRFGFTMPALIALVTQAWLRERKKKGREVAEILARLMNRAHAFGSENPLAAFHDKPEPIEAYFDATKNLPVATPLMRKDCSPICDGAAAVILTAKPQAVRVAGLGSATDTSSILDRASLSRLEATRRAAQVAYWRAGIASPREIEGLVVEAHDAFNSLLPIDLADLGLVDADDAVDALVGSLRAKVGDPYENPVTGVRGRVPTNLSGGLKARGHPVGGTGLFQICETYLQLTERFPNPRAQVRGARVGLAHSIGGPGNNVYVTVIERSDNARPHTPVPRPRTRFEGPGAKEPAQQQRWPGGRAVVEAATTIHVTADGVPAPVHVALVRIDGRRVFARLDAPPEEGQSIEELLAGQTVKLLVKDDGDHYLSIPRSRAFDLGWIAGLLRRGLGRAAPAEPETPSAGEGI